MANEKKAKLLDLSGTRPAVLLHGSRPSWSASNHDVFGKLTMFIKTMLKNTKKVERIKHYVPKRNLYLYFLVS